MKSTSERIGEKPRNAAGEPAGVVRFSSLALFAMLALAVSGCAHCPMCGGPWNRDVENKLALAPPADMRTVSGTVTCLERVAILPTFEMKVSLARLDTTSGKPEVMAEQTIGRFTSFPVPFALEYDHSKLVDGATYGLFAELTSQDSRLFCTDTQYKVLSKGNEGPVDLVIVRTPGK